MSSESDPTRQDGSPPDTSSSPTNTLQELFAEYLDRFEDEGETAIDSVCDAHPQHATAIRRWVDNLRRVGLLTAPKSDEDFPTHMGEFRLVRRIGGGGMGVVYLADQESLGRSVALKLVRPELLYFSGARERFRREVEAVARLQHPGIVPVYAVGEEQGVPYFAMEHVEGCSLAQAMKGLEGSPAGELRGEDLARVIARQTGTAVDSREDSYVFAGSWTDVCFRVIRQVAEALEHAHRRGVLHRDVKPSNIMITPSGRVMLLDFGLASTEEASAITRTGSQLGSLPYTSPEQVGGEMRDLDERADIYSLGVTLYELLTLRSPFLAETSEQTRQRILTGEPPRIRDLNPHVSWDAETVCRTALERDIGRRYATASDFARDLLNVIERRPIEARRPGFAILMRRWVQRHPTASVAAVLGTLLLIGGPSVFAWQQLEANRRLEKEQKAVEEANEELGLQRDAALTAKEEASRQEGLARAAERDAIAASQEAERQRTRAEEHLERALRAVDELLTRVSEERLKYLPQMEPVQRDLLVQALRFYEEFVAEQADDPRLRRLAAQAYDRVGRIQLSLGDQEAAAEARDQAIAMWSSLAEGEPESQGYSLGLAESHLGLAQVDRLRGRHREALAGAELARELLFGVDVEGPARREIRHARSSCLSLLGELASDRADHRAAEDLLREALALREALFHEDEGDLSLSRNLAVAERGLGVVLRVTGRNEEAEQLYNAALSRFESLAKNNADSPDLVSEVEKTRYRLAYLLFWIGRKGEAERLYEQALERQRQLVKDHPDVPDLWEQLGWTAFQLGNRMENTGRLERAEELQRESLELRDRLWEKYSDRPTYLRAAVMSRHYLGKVLQQTGRLQPAVDLYRDAIAMSENAPFVSESLLKESRASVFEELGLVLGWLDQTEEAVQAFQAAINEWGSIVAVAGDVPKFQKGLAISWRKLGILYYNALDNESAEKPYRESIAIFRRLTNLYPTDPHLSDHRAISENWLGILLDITDRPEESAELYRSAAAIWERLARDVPTEPDYPSHLGTALSNLGWQALKRGDVDEARTLVEQAIEFQGQAVAVQPRTPDYRTFHHKHHIVLLRVHQAAEDYEQSAVIAEKMTELLGAPAMDKRYAAGWVAAVIPAIQADVSLGEAAAALVERHAASTVKLLQQAIAAGYDDKEEMRQAPELEPLREREDFRKLLD